MRLREIERITGSHATTRSPSLSDLVLGLPQHGKQAVDQARRNDMSKRRRINPAAYLKSYRPLTNGLDPKVVGLRGNAHKRDRELVEACLFSYGLSRAAEEPMWVIDNEDSDFFR